MSTPTKETRSTCPYCGVGCGVVIESEGDRITGVRGDPDHPANFGRLCTKGSTLHLSASPVTWHSRLLQPMRRPARGQAPVPVNWDEALDEAAQRFAQAIERHGPDSVAFYVSGQLLTEDYYVFNKLAKGLVGTNNIDTNSRLCMSSAVAGYKQSLGADAPPCSYEDIAQASCVFVAGSNTAYAHPILFRRLEDARAANPQHKLIVVDPRRTDTAAVADLHLAILPGSDVALFHGMLHTMLWEGWMDRAYIDAHTTGFDALRDLVRDYPAAEAARVCGIPVEDLVTAARWFAQSPATISLYCQGLNQSSSGTAKNTALVNLHLATAQIGRPGAGPFSLTGQPNAMGGREVGALANLLSAHRDLGNAEHRAEVARHWGVPDVPAAPGLAAVELFEACAQGRIRALWIACTNPAQSMPDQARIREALQTVPYVVLQEAYATTATARYADLLLPAATWGEKEGTVTNSERRITRVRAAVPAPGQARPDWHITTDFARRLETRLGPKRADGATLFPYETPEAIWNEHRETTRGRDLDITGLSYARLDEGPQQWPCPEGAVEGRARLYEDGRYATPDGRARFVASPWKPVAEPRDVRYPVALTTGRLRDHWHGMSRTGTLGTLFGHVAEPSVDLHPSELRRLGLAEGDLAYVASRRASLLLPVRAAPEVAPAQAFIAMHWGEEFVGGRTGNTSPMLGVNALTTGANCPDSRQPELKHAAVKLRRAELPWELHLLAWCPAERALALREALRETARELDYVSCTLFAPPGTPDSALTGVHLRGAAHEAPPAEWLAQVEALLQLAPAQVLRYQDVRRGTRRVVALDPQDTHRLQAVLLAGDARGITWLGALLRQRASVQAQRRWLLRPVAEPPGDAMPVDSPTVCNCLGVSRAQIEGALQDAQGSPQVRLQQLQQRLQCGTQCGSCVPELRRMVQQGLAAA